MATRMLDLAIVTSVFNDFEAFWTLCAELSKAAGAMSVIAVFSDIVFVRLLILPSTISALRSLWGRVQRGCGSRPTSRFQAGPPI
jgi:hypothetical protein